MCGLGAGAFGRNGLAPPGIDQKVDLFRDGNWARTDMPTALRNVRYQEQSGKHLLIASISPFEGKAENICSY
jgi:hypothetical protein